MESKKNESDSKLKHNPEYGEPGFVFTDYDRGYDRGARKENSGDESKREGESSSEDN